MAPPHSAFPRTFNVFSRFFPFAHGFLTWSRRAIVCISCLSFITRRKVNHALSGIYSFSSSLSAGSFIQVLLNGNPFNSWRSEFNSPFFFLVHVRSCYDKFFFLFLEENDHLKAENRSLKKDLLTAIENASGNKKVPLKGAIKALILVINFHTFFLDNSKNLLACRSGTCKSISKCCNLFTSHTSWFVCHHHHHHHHHRHIHNLYHNVKLMC